MNLENLSGLDKARRYHCPITKSLLPQQTSKIPTQTKQYKQSYKTLDTKTTGDNEQPKSRNTKGQTVDNTHYSVSGGPMTVTLHSKMLLSSTSPAENPSTGFFVRSDPRTRDRSSDEKNHISLSSGSIWFQTETLEASGSGQLPFSCFWRRRLAWVCAAIRDGEDSREKQKAGRG